jgi:hypothetical protein
MRRRDRPLDIFRRLTLSRLSVDPVSEESSNVDHNSSSHVCKSNDFLIFNVYLNFKTKKKLNIPVGDVKIDEEYDSFIPATYSIPTGYVKHTKKMNDEPDLIVDYCCEDDDEVIINIDALMYNSDRAPKQEWISGKIAVTDEKFHYGHYLTVELVEIVFNVLERLTGVGDSVSWVSVPFFLCEIYSHSMQIYLKLVFTV